METRILMVCLGNICRSPMAKGILQKKLKDKNITWVEVDSAGTSDYHEGGKADRRTLESALKHGIDLSSHRARPFNREDFSTFDRIYVMDSENYSNVVYYASNQNEMNKVKMILDEIETSGNEPLHLSVPDPWFGGEKDFEKVFTMLDEACDAIINKLKVENETTK